jgi:voltage-gated potassium channel
MLVRQRFVEIAQTYFGPTPGGVVLCMDESARKLLGIRKKASWLYESWYYIRKRISLGLIVVVALLLLFLAASILFARFEITARPEMAAMIESTGANTYFVAVYWLVTTLTAVGYGDIVPLTTAGRIVAMCMMVLGIIAVSLLISQITSRIVSMRLGSMFGVSKTRKKIDCILCGWNPISQSAFQEIKQPGVEIVVVDPLNRPELAREKDVHFIVGDPADPGTLKRANITNARNIVLAMEEDSQVLLAIHVVRELNPWINIVAKINNHEHIKIAESAGADQVVSPPSIGGRLLSMVAGEPSAVDWLTRAMSREKGMVLREYDITKDSPLADKTVGYARTAFGDTAKIIGVDTTAGFEKVPCDDLKIEHGNKLIMLVDTKRFEYVI